jgi:hypothetical protein
MAYYYGSETPENHAGTLFIGATFVDEKTHASIMSKRDEVLSIVNNHTIDCVVSRSTGTAVYSPIVEFINICCTLFHRAENPNTIDELRNSSFVSYRAEAFSSSQKISMPESRAIEGALCKWFDDITRNTAQKEGRDA